MGRKVKPVVFSSAVFLWLFLPAVLLFYFLAAKPLRNVLLVAASLLFYAWGEPNFVVILLVSIALNYVFGILVDRELSRGGTKAPRIVLAAAVAVNLSLLVYFKYINFLLDQINPMLNRFGGGMLHLGSVELPIGISFFTFHAISYLVDLYRQGGRAIRNPIDLALYISFFPQLVAGPIVRYHQIAEQLKERRATFEGFSYGIARFVIGLGKKVLLANQLGFAADKLFAAAPEGGVGMAGAWLGILCYTLQIYFDFSGYSDMAVGLARMFGFKFPENFNYPYISRSLREFWQRWHISLSSWFREYVYFPLGGNRRGQARTYLNLLIVFFLTGFWHGASWNFIVWGMLHGVFMAAERTGPGKRLLAKAWPPLLHLYTLFVVAVTWVFFRAETLPGALTYLRIMFGGGTDAGAGAGAGGTSAILAALPPEFWAALFVGLFAAMPIFPWMRAWAGPRLSKLPAGKLAAVRFMYETAGAAALLAVFAACAMLLARSTYNPFIYFRF